MNKYLWLLYLEFTNSLWHFVSRKCPFIFEYMLPYIEVLMRLDHKQFRSGQQLANSLGVTRATIHNCILRIDALGIAIQRVRGKGYKLNYPLDLLNESQIKASLLSPLSKRLKALKIQLQTPSTNTAINNDTLPSIGEYSVLLAEMQTAGKGRRGRSWISPFGANIYMSVLTNIAKPLTELSALSPLIAICVVKALKKLGIKGLGLKWPNDIYCNNKKIAGILIECSGEMGGTTKFIIGVGVNVYMSRHMNIVIEQQWTDVISNLQPESDTITFTRSGIAAGLLNQIIPAVNTFNSSRSRSLTHTLPTEWAQWDVLHNKRVILKSEMNDTVGIARGLSSDGCLLLETERGIRHISAGDVSMRIAS